MGVEDHVQALFHWCTLVLVFGTNKSLVFIREGEHPPVAIQFERHLYASFRQHVITLYGSGSGIQGPHLLGADLFPV